MNPRIQELRDEIHLLQMELDELIASERKNVISEVKEKMEIYGLQAADLGIIVPSRSNDLHQRMTPVRGRIAPKYQKSGKTWSGRGRKPLWVQQHIDQGGSLDELRI